MRCMVCTRHVAACHVVATAGGARFEVLLTGGKELKGGKDVRRHFFPTDGATASDTPATGKGEWHSGACNRLQRSQCFC
jgi:hypothetical protein